MRKAQGLFARKYITFWRKQYHFLKERVKIQESFLHLYRIFRFRKYSTENLKIKEKKYDYNINVKNLKIGNCESYGKSKATNTNKKNTIVE